LKEDNRVVALKALEKESVGQMKHVDHILNEREILQFFSDKTKERNDSKSNLVICPFIMDIFSSFQDKDNLYFEIEYVEGCTLLS
jgi:serine/threonine protein kinase